MRAGLLLAAVVFASCGRVDGPLPGVKRDGLVGGTTDTGDPQVFELRFAEVGNPSNRARCTGTLIGSRTIVTAGHCVDPSTLGATAITMYVVNVTDDSTAQASDQIQVTKMAAHPMYNNVTFANDLALVLLEHPPAGVTPKDWNAESLAALAGKPIRVVGYGDNVGGSSASGRGTKREAALTFGSIAANTFQLGDGFTKGICHGDSGGPSFHTFPDGVERLVGVHSLTLTDACTLGTDTRVDPYGPFIEGWVAQNELAASCAEDGRCAQDCPSPDLDCVCAADGQCTTACPDASKDPDCPADCAQNGACSQVACPAPDPDCVADGQPCTDARQCVARQCLSDAQHTQTYCSKGCTVDADCTTPGMTCDPTSHVCTYPPPPVTLPTLGAKHPAAARGCASVNGALPLVGVLGLLRRRRVT
jgi:V8-like Glu-specific endopeptidase